MRQAGTGREEDRASRCGLLGGAPALSVPESQCKHHGRRWKASGSGTQRMEAVRTILEGQSPERVKRLMFISFVQGAELSGLTSMTLEPRHCAHWDRVLLGMLRSQSGELRVRQKQGKEVFRSWALLHVAEELHVAEGTMVPEMGATPERPPRGGHCCAGDVQSRRNGRGLAAGERGKRLPDQHINGKTNG